LKWRRGWDSNPRLSFPNTRFPSVLLKPLGHLSGSGWKMAESSVAESPNTGKPPYGSLARISLAAYTRFALWCFHTYRDMEMEWMRERNIERIFLELMYGTSGMICGTSPGCAKHPSSPYRLWSK
jgi:hypothetical protein